MSAHIIVQFLPNFPVLCTMNYMEVKKLDIKFSIALVKFEKFIVYETGDILFYRFRWCPEMAVRKTGQ